MFVYRLIEPIDLFDGLTPLSRWLAAGSPTRTQWALTAILALDDAADQVGWRGDMRHLPMVGGLPTSPFTTPYLVVKQDDDGATFIIADSEPPWVGDHSRQAEVALRTIGAWEPDDTDFAAAQEF
jgi:hypothetical protein